MSRGQILDAVHLGLSTQESIFKTDQSCPLDNLERRNDFTVVSTGKWLEEYVRTSDQLDSV